MPKGGARRGTGPAPSPDALRRERDGREWTRLPASGRVGETPAWPEEMGDASLAELEMWEKLWKTPQAIVWEADGVQLTVAMYVRTFMEARLPEASASARTLVLRLQGELLLSITALHSARYVIDGRLEGVKLGLRDDLTRSSEGGQVIPMAAGESVRNRFPSS